MACAGGALAPCAGAPAVADDPCRFTWLRSYTSPGVSATRDALDVIIRSSASSANRWGDGRARSSVSWLMSTVSTAAASRGCYPVRGRRSTVDSGGGASTSSESARLSRGFSTPEAAATIDSVTLVAHA